MESWLHAVRFDEQGLIPAIAQDWQTGRVLMVAWMNAEALQLTAARRQAIYWSRSRQKLWHKGESSGHTQQVHEIRLDCDGDVIVMQVSQAGGIACHTGRESCFYQLLTAQGWQPVDPVKRDPADIYGMNDANQASSAESAEDTAKDTAAALAQTAISTPVPAVTDHVDSPDSTEPNQPDSGAIDRDSILSHLGQLIQLRRQGSEDRSYIASLYRKGLDHILKKVGEETTETVMAAKDAGFDAQPQALEQVIYETADLWFHTLVMLGVFNIPPAAILDELARRTVQSGLAEKAARMTDD